MKYFLTPQAEKSCFYISITLNLKWFAYISASLLDSEVLKGTIRILLVNGDILFSLEVEEKLWIGE